MINIGILNTKINLERKVVNKNPLIDTDFEPYRSIWCSMQNLSEREKITAEKLNIFPSKKLIIRYRKELDLDYHKDATKDYRCSYKTRIYNIVSICVLDDREFMEILLEAE